MINRRRRDQAASDGDHGIMAIGKWGGRQNRGEGPATDGRDDSLVKTPDHNDAGLGPFKWHATVFNTVILRNRESVGWRRDKRRE